MQHALIIGMAQYDHKRPFLDLVLLPVLSDLCPFGRAVVGDLPDVVRGGGAAMNVHGRLFLVKSDDSTLPLDLFFRGRCFFFFGRGLVSPRREGGEYRPREYEAKQSSWNLHWIL